MKISKYNFFYSFEKDDRQVIAYNARTNALALLDKKKYDKFDQFRKNNIEIEDKQLIDDLKKGSFIIDDNIDELSLIKHTIFRNRYATRQLGLILAPTMNCNFDCVYCYEKENRRSLPMSEEVQEKILEIISSNLPYVQLVDLTWYGGEPLLAIDIIENMSKKIISLCENKKVTYSAGIITNGYRLSKEVAERLKAVNVNHMQITLDGPKDIHNERRPLVGGNETFDKILRNISEVVGIIQNISIRINTDKENADRVYELLDEMDKYNLQGKIHVYLGYVEPTNECYCTNKCLNVSGFAQVDYNFQNVLIDRGYCKDMTAKYPSLKANFCCADAENSYVIDPKGNMYKCWSDIGIEEYSVGNVLNSEVSGNVERLMNYMTYDVTSDEECNDCVYLPLCVGGCPRRRVDKETERCTNYKYSLEMYAKEITESLYEAQQKEKECS